MYFMLSVILSSIFRTSSNIVFLKVCKGIPNFSWVSYPSSKKYRSEIKFKLSSTGIYFLCDSITIISKIFSIKFYYSAK